MTELIRIKNFISYYKKHFIFTRMNRRVLRLQSQRGDNVNILSISMFFLHMHMKRNFTSLVVLLKKNTQGQNVLN